MDKRKAAHQAAGAAPSQRIVLPTGSPFARRVGHGAGSPLSLRHVSDPHASHCPTRSPALQRASAHTALRTRTALRQRAVRAPRSYPAAPLNLLRARVKAHHKSPAHTPTSRALGAPARRAAKLVSPPQPSPQALQPTDRIPPIHPLIQPSPYVSCRTAESPPCPTVLQRLTALPCGLGGNDGGTQVPTIGRLFGGG